MAASVSKPSSVKHTDSHDARRHTGPRGMETRARHEGGSGHSTRYHIIKTIGKGNFAKVKLAKHILTGQEVAIKIIDKTHMNATSLQKLRREVRIMKLLDHPNIVKLYEVIETEKSLNLVMEYASRGELFDYLVANGRMKEKEARVLFRQIISAIQYCHQKRILHRDLKAENLLLDEDLNVKIADFGFSNEFSLNSKLDTFCGSPPYAAPELFQGKKYDGPEVDVWSLGVILYTLVSGSLPFDGQNLKELRERVLRGKYRIPFYMTTDCENLLKKFLVLNPLKRATLEVIMKDLWLNTGYEESKLKPYEEPPVHVDARVIDKMVLLGFKRREIEESLNDKAYNYIMATYLLLCRQAAIARSNLHDPAGSDGMIKSSSVLRTTSLTEQKTNKTSNVTNKNESTTANSGPNKNTNDSPQVPQPEHSELTAKVVRSISVVTSNIDKLIIRKNTQENFQGIQKASNDMKLNVTTTPTTTNITTPTFTETTIAPNAALHHSINVPQGRSSTPANNHSALSNFNRSAVGRTTMPPSALQSSEQMTSNDSAMNNSVGDENHLTNTSISKAARKSLLHRISSKFYRNKSNRKSGGLSKNNKKPQKDVNSSLNRMKTSNETFSSIATTTTNDKSNVKPRSLHFTWHLRNTSNAEAEKMVHEIRQVLDNNHCDYYQTAPFLVNCSHHGGDHAAGNGSSVQWLMEVCRLPRLSMNGVKFKRISGPPLIYKNIITKISNELKF